MCIQPSQNTHFKTPCHSQYVFQDTFQDMCCKTYILEHTLKTHKAFQTSRHEVSPRLQDKYQHSWNVCISWACLSRKPWEVRTQLPNNVLRDMCWLEMLTCVRPAFCHHFVSASSHNDTHIWQRWATPPAISMRFSGKWTCLEWQGNSRPSIEPSAASPHGPSKMQPAPSSMPRSALAPQTY